MQLDPRGLRGLRIGRERRREQAAARPRRRPRSRGAARSTSADDHDGAATRPSARVGDARGIGCETLDVVDGDAQRVGRDLREDRLGALADVGASAMRIRDLPSAVSIDAARPAR